MAAKAATLAKLPQGSGRQSVATLEQIQSTAGGLASRLAKLQRTVAAQRGLQAGPGPSGGGEVLMIQLPAITEANSDATQTAQFLSAPSTVTFLKSNPDVIPGQLQEPETWSRNTSCTEAKRTKLSKEVGWGRYDRLGDAGQCKDENHRPEVRHFPSTRGRRPSMLSAHRACPGSQPTQWLGLRAMTPLARSRITPTARWSASTAWAQQAAAA